MVFAPISTVWSYQKLAANREFLSAFFHDRDILTITEALRLIKEQGRMSKPRVRAIVVPPDAEPAVLLEAKLKNYVINLYLLRYLEAEIHQLLEGINLKPEQLLRALHHVCKEHQEVQGEVIRTFQPKLKLVDKKGA